MPSTRRRGSAVPEDEAVPRNLGHTLARTYLQSAVILAVGGGLGLGAFALVIAVGVHPLAAFGAGLLVFGTAVVVAAVRAGTVVSRGQRGSGPFFVVSAVLVVVVLTAFDTTGLIWVIALLVPLLAALVGRWAAISGRRSLPAVTGLVVLLALLSVDVWLGERAEVQQVLGDVAGAGVTVWVPTGEDTSCGPRYVSNTGPGVLRYSWWCGTVRDGYVDVTLRADASRPDAPAPSVRRQQEGTSSFSMVATTVRSGVVLEVRHVGAGGEGRAEQLAGSMTEVPPTWLASRGLPLHELALGLGAWGSARPGPA